MAKETKLYEVEKPAERVILVAVDEDGSMKDVGSKHRGLRCPWSPA